MAEKKISNLSRNYNEYRNSILDIARQYYPDVFANINDASIGQFLIDVISDIGDNLNYHIDNTLQETTLDNAQTLSSIKDIARTNGIKLPGKKAALVEVELSCQLPIYEQGESGNGDMKADERYCPYIKRGTQFSNGTTTFELLYDLDFKEAFNNEGMPDRQIIPFRDYNGKIISYTYKKLGVATASQTKMLKTTISANDLKPFMDIVLTESDVIGVDSIIMKDGRNNNSTPTLNEFFVDKEIYYDKDGKEVTRFFEVENLVEQERFGYVIEENEDGTSKDDYEVEGVTYKSYYNPIWYISDKVETYDKDGNKKILPAKLATKGKWKRLKHKFITEYDDNNKLKIIFGSGLENINGEIPTDAEEFLKYQMSKMAANDYMGVLPKANHTLYILYRVGGGEISNIAKDTLTNIISLDVNIDGNCDDNQNSNKINNVRKSITVTNTTPSYGGKDGPTIEELRYIIKYNASSQNRCVTLKDYHSRLNNLPSKYGTPFRFSVTEENNKIVIYTLGLDSNGQLSNFLSETVAENMREYLSHYKMLNDFIEIKSGKIINIAFKAKVYIDNNFDNVIVTKQIIDTINSYMDIRKHLMGEDIFIGDLQKEISKIDGVINLVSLKVYNKVGEGYSENTITQTLVGKHSCNNDEDEVILDNEIDLTKSDYMLYSDANSMFEIKYMNRDITVEVKSKK